MTEKEEHSVTPGRRKAFSYLRFSTPEQSKGDSFRRQSTMAQAYALKHGLDLDEALTFHDFGVSGFRGKNAETGRLADFREAVRAGQVPPGSVLLVEQFDRLSRMVPRKAVRVLEDILEEGVSVVTLNDGQEYTADRLDEDPHALFMVLLVAMRAHEESETKRRRGMASWEGKRANMAARPMTSRAPAWLQLDRDVGAFSIIPERGELVRRIYRMTLEGMGQHKIAETFNQEGIAPWGRASFWQRSYIAKVLGNPAVIGTVTPHVMENDGHRKRRRPLEPVVGYFPAVIEPDMFASVQVLGEAQGAPTRGRHAHAPISNILAGLACCPACGKTMTRVQKGSRSKPSFVCTTAKAGAGCQYKSVSYALIERRLLEVLPAGLREREGAAGVQSLEDQIANLDDGIDRWRDDIEGLVDSLTKGSSRAVMSRIEELEQELEEAIE